MTIDQFNKVVDEYCKARQHTQWLNKHLGELPAVNSPAKAKSVFGASIDQERAALRSLLEASNKVQLPK